MARRSPPPLPIHDEAGRVPSERSLRSPRDLAALVYYGGYIDHLPMKAAGDRRWAASWNFLPVVSPAPRLDLYIRDMGGTIGGFLFFRDPRLPGLFGEGVTCEGNLVTIRERVQGMTMTGTFSPPADTFRVEVEALAGPVT